MTTIEEEVQTVTLVAAEAEAERLARIIRVVVAGWMASVAALAACASLAL